MTDVGTTRLEKNRLVNGTAVLFIVSMATLVQSYVAVKLFFLVLFLVTSVRRLVREKVPLRTDRRITTFYLWTSTAGVVWAFIGLLHRGNHVEGILESVRLYAVWSAAFAILYTLFTAKSSLRIVHTAIVLAGILIPIINFVGLYDQFYGLGLISESVRQELDMGIAFGDGYIQITSQNIDVMFLIVPYLISLQFHGSAEKSNSILTKSALVLSLILAAVSGRRALWLVVALTPIAILVLSQVTGCYGFMRARARQLLLFYTFASVFGFGMLMLVPDSLLDFGSINRLKQAFSSEDERSIQKPYLIDGYLKSPLLGSGFGAAAAYVRNEERPWTGYELTYYQMLFNLGTLGVVCLGALFLSYLKNVVSLIRNFKETSAIPFAILIGYCCFLMGAYSNRYFGSFDLLFFVGLLPYLSTFRNGFDQNRPQLGVST